MLPQVSKLFIQHNIHSHDNSGITLVTVTDAEQGIFLAQQIIEAVCDTTSLLLLSGGSTPKSLYTKLAHDERLLIGAVGLIDERYGKKWHEASNEKMIRETGFLRYLQMRDIVFYPILQEGFTREETAEEYDEKLRSLFAVYPKIVATFGIGADGHTAGIAGNRRGFVNPIFDRSEKDFFVSEFDDVKGSFKERVTMTFLGIAMFDINIVLVFGSEKKKALELMFDPGREEDIPARIFKRPEIAKKTVLITDQLA